MNSWSYLLPGVKLAAATKVVRDWRVSEDDAERIAQGLLELAADCRLAFASVAKLENFREPRGNAPEEALVSRTALQGSRGRPRTTRWVYWACFYIREQVDLGLSARVTTRQLASLVHLLTGRLLTPYDLGREFVSVRAEAVSRASA